MGYYWQHKRFCRLNFVLFLGGGWKGVYCGSENPFKAEIKIIHTDRPSDCQIYVYILEKEHKAGYRRLFKKKGDKQHQLMRVLT